MTTTTPLEFDVSAPLPPGTVVLEASAGTGKTHAVAALAVRLLGEGDTTIDRLLMVTFGRNATRELRARVRHHLIEATMTAQPGLTRDRLEAAVAGFDSARLMTIHEFCAAMYDELGILATADPSGEVVTDLRPLAEQVARDLYLSRYAFDERQPPFALHDLKRDGVTTTGALSLADAALQQAIEAATALLRSEIKAGDSALGAEIRGLRVDIGWIRALLLVILAGLGTLVFKAWA